MTAGLKALLTALHDIGTSDIYTDADEYTHRTGAMHELCGMAGSAANGREIDLARVREIVSEGDLDGDDTDGATEEVFGDDFEGEDDEDDAELCGADGCDVLVTGDDPYYATPCGTFCDEHMAEHIQQCGVCAAEFWDDFPDYLRPTT